MNARIPDGLYTVWLLTKYEGENQAMVLPLLVKDGAAQIVVEWQDKSNQLDATPRRTVPIDCSLLQPAGPEAEFDFLFQGDVTLPEGIDF